MPEPNFLSGSNRPFSDCNFVFSYKYTGGTARGTSEPKLSELQESTIENIHRGGLDVPLIEREAFTEKVREMVRERRAGNFTKSVIANSEQLNAADVLQVVEEVTQYIRQDTKKSLTGVVLSARSGGLVGEKLRSREVKRPLQSCKFGFDFRYNDEKGFNEEFIRGNTINITSTNPNIRKIIDIPKEEVTEEDISLGTRGFVVDFSIETDEMTPDVVQAVTNAVDAFADKAANSRAPPDKTKNMITVV